MFVFMAFFVLVGGGRWSWFYIKLSRDEVKKHRFDSRHFVLNFRAQTKLSKSPTSETKIRDCSFAQNYAQMILAYWATATNGKGTPRQWVSPGVPSACQHRQASFTAKNIIVLCFFRWTCADSTEQNHSFPFSDSTLTTTIMSSYAPPATTSPDRPSTNNPQDPFVMENIIAPS